MLILVSLSFSTKLVPNHVASSFLVGNLAVLEEARTTSHIPGSHPAFCDVVVADRDTRELEDIPHFPQDLLGRLVQLLNIIACVRAAMPCRRPMVGFAYLFRLTTPHALPQTSK